MYNNKKFLAIIPARSGSKGLPHKNIKQLNGKPMIAYTIQAAIQSDLFDRIIVSTDDEEYAQISREYGAEVPFLRNEDLAQDHTTITDVLLDVLGKLEDMREFYDYFMLLQPTSPLRDAEDIKESVKMIFDKNGNAVVSMCPVEHPIEWATYLEEEKKIENFIINKSSNLRQGCKQAYRLNGAIYLTDIVYYKKYKNFYKENCYAYIMTKHKSIDIDDLYDFYYAESVLGYSKGKQMDLDDKKERL